MVPEIQGNVYLVRLYIKWIKYDDYLSYNIFSLLVWSRLLGSGDKFISLDNQKYSSIEIGMKKIQIFHRSEMFKKWFFYKSAGEIKY